MVRLNPRRLAGLLAAAGALAALLLSAAAPAVVAAPRVQPRIVGGQDASAGEYPFMAYVEVRYGNARARCGGALVAARYVVTAGHCVAPDGNLTPTVADVAIGVTTIDAGRALSDPANTVPAADKFLNGEIIRNPDYAEIGSPLLGDPTPVNDVAIIRLRTPAPFAQLRLPRPEDAALWAAGATATAIGFGATASGAPIAGRLLEVQLPIASDATCQSIPGYEDYRPDVNVCAGGQPGKDTCQGDSGGPLLVPDGTGAFVLGGVTSYGLGCGETFGVYAEDGAAALDAFLRGHIPQAEVTPSIAAPFAGDQVTYTAALHDPDAAGPLGGYDSLAWDLDGDGVFAENVGALTAMATVRAGVNSVAVAATDGAGNAEVRRIAVLGRTPVLVAFGSPSVTVDEGDTATLSVVKNGAGAGTVVATPAGTTTALVTATPVTATFAAGDATRPIGFATRENAKVEGPRTFTVALGATTGDLRLGAPATATVTVRDDDGRVKLSGSRTAHVRRSRFALKAKPNRGGTLKATATSGGRTVAKSSTRTVRSSAERSLSLELTSRGKRLLTRQGELKVKVTVTFAPSGGGVLKTARRTVTLRGAGGG